MFGNNSQNGYSDYNDYEGGTTAGVYGMGSTPNQMRSVAAPASSPHVEQVDHVEHDETSEREDLLDQHVAYYLKHHPEVHKKHHLVRVRPGVYNFNGREISVEWHYSEIPDEPGYLIAIDGPLRQPFADYMQDNENGIEYDDKRLGKSSLSQVPKGKRLSFGDGNKVYSRLEAMKVAKEQALVREKAAEFAKDGMPVPQYELMTKYKKTISQKLGERRQRRPEPEGPVPQQTRQPQEPVAQPPAEAPVAAPAPAPAASPKAASPQGKGKQTHGAPKYCAKHDKSEKRKKCKPQNLPCSVCQAVIQTNYVEFALCPTCSEKDHRCMCCGAPAVGAPAASPKAPQVQQRPQAPSSPMNASPQHVHSKSPTHQPSPTSGLNLFGMPDLFNGSGPTKQSPEPQSSGGGGVFNGGTIISALQGLSPSRGTPTTVMQPQGNAYASNNAFTSQKAMTSQNHYASQNANNAFVSNNAAFTSYSPVSTPQNAMASQNIIVGRR